MSKVLTGSKASLKINGTKVAFMSQVSVTEENSLEAINVLDQLEVAEHAETGHVVSFTCNLFKVVTNSVSSLGISPDVIDDILTQPELTMEIFNRISGDVEYTVSGVKWEGGTGSVDAKGVWQGTWNFKGRIGRGL